MTAVASKNLYDLLGNDHEYDSDKEPEPPVKVVDKTPARTDKRNAPREAPVAPAGGNRRQGPGGNEGAFRDRNAGSAANRGKPTEERGGRAQGTYEGRGRGRGGRGGRGGAPGDRHSRGLAANSDKQAGHGWGENAAGAELADEQAAEAIAKSDEKEALAGDGTDAPVNAEGETLPEEPEDNSKSYDEYLKELAEKKLALGGSTLEVRKPNEGVKENKKWASAKALEKEEEADFIAGGSVKARRERERKAKVVVDIDQRFVEAPERGGRGEGRGGRGGRGGERGGRGRGEGRGRGGGEFRGSRGGDRGGRGRGDAPSRGPRGGPRGGAPINTADASAFPALGK